MDKYTANMSLKEMHLNATKGEFYLPVNQEPGHISLILIHRWSLIYDSLLGLLSSLSSVEEGLIGTESISWVPGTLLNHEIEETFYKLVKEARSLGKGGLNILFNQNLEYYDERLSHLRPHKDIAELFCTLCKGLRQLELTIHGVSGENPVYKRMDLRPNRFTK